MIQCKYQIAHEKSIGLENEWEEKKNNNNNDHKVFISIEVTFWNEN